MNKKIFFLFIVASFFFLFPLTVKAEDVGYRNSWSSWSSTRGGSALPNVNNVFQFDSLVVNSSTAYRWHSFYFYPNINNTWSVGDYDYIVLNYVVIGGSAVETIYYGGDPPSHSVEEGIANSVQYVVMYTKPNVQTTTDVPCYDLGHSGLDGGIIQGSVYCPVANGSNGFSHIVARTFVNVEASGTGYTWMVGLDHVYMYHYSGGATTGIESAINSQTTEITDSLGEVNDSLNDNSSSSAENQGSSLFGNFSAPSNPLTSIVTLPLQLLSAATDTCQPIGLWFNWSVSGLNLPDKNVSLPCGTTLFWENPDLMGGSGNKLVNFRNFWNLLIGGPIIYGLLVLIYKEVNAALDPLSDSVITYDKVSKSNEEKKSEDKDGDSSG